VTCYVVTTLNQPYSHDDTLQHHFVMALIYKGFIYIVRIFPWSNIRIQFFEQSSHIRFTIPVHRSKISKHGGVE